MKKNILSIVKNNGRTLIGVVAGLAIAGSSLMMARKSDDETYDDYEIIEVGEDEEETECEEVSTEEESGEN